MYNSTPKTMAKTCDQKYAKQLNETTLSSLQKRVDQPSFVKSHAAYNNKQNSSSLNQPQNKVCNSSTPNSYSGSHFPLTQSYCLNSSTNFKQDPQMQKRIDQAVKKGQSRNSNSNSWNKQLDGFSVKMFDKCSNNSWNNQPHELPYNMMNNGQGNQNSNQYQNQNYGNQYGNSPAQNNLARNFANNIFPF